MRKYKSTGQTAVTRHRLDQTRTLTSLFYTQPALLHPFYWFPFDPAALLTLHSPPRPPWHPVSAPSQSGPLLPAAKSRLIFLEVGVYFGAHKLVLTVRFVSGHCLHFILSSLCLSIRIIVHSASLIIQKSSVTQNHVWIHIPMFSLSSSICTTD